jgi:hypothetical protein
LSSASAVVVGKVDDVLDGRLVVAMLGVNARKKGDLIY